jgi:hypothetical protein
MEQKKAESQALTELCSRLEQWRKAGGGRGSRMPEELWQEAVHVARSAGLYATAKATRIKYEALKERCEPASLGPLSAPVGAGPRQGSQAVAARGQELVGSKGTGGGKGPAPAPSGPGTPGGARFVTLPAVAPCLSSQTTIEVVGRQGDRMRVECAGPVDVVGLVQTWWSRS